jgi:glycerol kinase
MAVVIAIDAGTTGIRAVAVDDVGRPVDSAYREFTQHFPRPGWVEHDAEEIWNATGAVLEEVAARRAEAGDGVAAIGITNQRETVVSWSRRTGEPRHRAIVWQDRRTAARCDELAAGGHLDLVRSRTGLVLDPYFSGTKMAWLLGEGGVVADDDLALGTVDAWLLWRLTDGASFVTEPSNASRTMVYDIVDRAWSPELCDLLGVPVGALPEVRPSSGELGRTAPGTPGVGGGVAITGVLGDQQAALFGQGCVEPGMAKNTYGTGSFVLMHVGDTCPEPIDGLLSTVAWELADGTFSYALEGAIFVTGAAVQWLRDGLEVIADAPEVEALAAQVPDAEGVVIVPAFTGLGSPWWDPYARGAVLGITRGTTRAHLARAVLDSIALQTRDVVEAMSEASGYPITALRVDGGASANDLLLQLQADQLGVPVQRPVVAETTVLGAALAAGLGAGVWSDLEEVGRAWTLGATFERACDPSSADAAHARWREAVGRARGWAPTDA